MFQEFSRDKFFGPLVAVIAFIVYANSLTNGFTLDDPSVILNNPALKGSFLSIFNIIDTVNDTQLLPLYRPVTYLSYMAEWHLHGFNPFLVRLANVLLHSANTYLVYRLARTLFKDNLYAPLLTALFFAVHPLQSEGVDFNAGGRNTMLACFFSLSTYLFYTHSILHQRSFYAYTGAVAFLAGLFSKEMALMVLPFIVFVEISRLRASGYTNRLQTLLRLTPYFAAVACYMILRWMTLSKYGIQTSIIPGAGTKLLENLYVISDFNTRILNNIYIIPRYLLTVVWPLSLSPRYSIPEDLNLLALPLFCAWLCILGGLGWIFTRGRSAASFFGLAWLILFWLPVSGIAIIPIPMAERYLYLPAIGLWIITSDQICTLLLNQKHQLKKYIYTVMCVLLIVLAGLTMRRNLDWKSNLTLYSRFVEQYPDSVHAHAGLGSAYYYGKGKDRNISLAEAEFNKTLAMDPYSPMIHTYLGNIKLNEENLSSALNHYNKAIEIYPYDKEARINRGITLEKLGRAKEAYTDYLFFLTSPGSFDNISGGREHAEKRIREITQ